MTRQDIIRVFIVAQHNYGIGHFFRAAALARSLASHSRVDVTLFSGGPPVHSLLDLSAFRFVQLPPLCRSSTKRSPAGHLEPDIDNKRVHRRRATVLLEATKHSTPDVIVTEFYPLSPHRLHETLFPLLVHCRDRELPTKFVCSIRDVPLSDSEESYARQAGTTRTLLQNHYSLVLHHCDEAFPMDEGLRLLLQGIPVVRTGFVTRFESQRASECWRRHSLAAAKRLLITLGGGIDGFEIARGCLNHLDVLRQHYQNVDVICGPRMPEE